MKTQTILTFLFLIAYTAATAAVTLLYSSASPYPPLDGGYFFTFAQITDSHSSGSREMLGNVTSWLAGRENLSFVVHTGDIVNSPYDERAWRIASEYMHRLDNRSRWAVLAGDNDVLWGNQVNLANFERYFAGNSVDQYFTVGGRLLFILFSWSTEHGAISQARLAWMDEVIRTHDELDVVICLHPSITGIPLLDIVREEMSSVRNSEEIWKRIEQHQNVIMVLNGHTHLSWVTILNTGKGKVWSISTKALSEEGYIRLFDVYEDRIEVYAHSPRTNRSFKGPLDRFTIELSSSNYDVDGDLWTDESDTMPTHPLVPNAIVAWLIIVIGVSAYWVAQYLSRRSKGLKARS